MAGAGERLSDRTAMSRGARGVGKTNPATFDAVFLQNSTEMRFISDRCARRGWCGEEGERSEFRRFVGVSRFPCYDAEFHMLKGEFCVTFSQRDLIERSSSFHERPGYRFKARCRGIY